MASKMDFKTVQTDNENLEEIEEKIRKHRRRIIRRFAIAVIVIVTIGVCFQLWSALRTYSKYEVRSKTERQDSVAAKYTTFLGKLVEYNNDGIVYKDENDELIWNQSFEMSTPMVSICEGYLAIYDRGGTLIYIMTSSGMAKKIETTTPISTVCIANQGTVAVLMKEDNVSTVRMYDRKGKELTNGEFYEEKGSFPVDIALSNDAQKLAVDMLDVTEGSVRSTVSFYNFGSVGQNEIDNNVGTYTYDDTFISEISYVASNRMIAIEDSGYIVFEGAQKPAPKREVKFKTEVQSVFYDNKYVGIVYSSPKKEGCWNIKVYDMAGKTVELTVNTTPTEKEARNVLVVPLADESKLYYYNWVQNNIRKVNEATNGEVGYIHIPDMGVDGLNEFVKHYYPQLNKKALIIDDRGNGGGNVSPMITERLMRTPTFYTMHTNQTVGSVSPVGTFLGPKVLLVNEYSASDGDLFPYRFKYNHLGTIIGRRTWGGVVGYSGSIRVVDGGSIVTPSYAPFAADGSEFIIEGTGVAPHVDIENDPYLEYNGEDQQLNKAIQVILEKLKTEKKEIPSIPVFPNKAAKKK